jgi:chromate reductase
MTKIAVFVGSLRKDSFNMQLAHALERVAPKGTEFNYVDLNLPLFNQDLEANYPPEAQKVKDAVEAADGVLFVTPEYNRSVPAVLKNAIDWASRPWGTNSFKNKPAGVVGASISALGTAVAQSDLHHVLLYLDMKVLGQPEVYVAHAHEVFDDEGNISPENEEFYRNYMQRLVEWIDAEEDR